MNKIAKFEKVSEAQFYADWCKQFEIQQDAAKDEIKKIYDTIKIPVRATKGSAGYDFFSPAELVVAPGKTVVIPTGIRVRMEQGWVLTCYPRSGLGFKFGLQLNNTVGIIDSDYYDSDNEGHIFAKLVNRSVENKTVVIHAGDGFMQGVFLPFGVTVDDETENVRNGGFGSTTKEPEKQ